MLRDVLYDSKINFYENVKPPRSHLVIITRWLIKQFCFTGARPVSHFPIIERETIAMLHAEITIRPVTWFQDDEGCLHPTVNHSDDGLPVGRTTTAWPTIPNITVYTITSANLRPRSRLIRVPLIKQLMVILSRTTWIKKM